MTVMAEDLAATTNVGGNTAQTIAPRLREHLRGVAEQRLPVTYLEVAKALGLRPPNTIRQVAEALEHLMTEDAATDRPFIAAIVISKALTQSPRTYTSRRLEACSFKRKSPRAPRH